MTSFPELFAALNAPFEGDEVRTRTQAGRQLAYITARAVMNRLDTVLGPENWWDDYAPGENSVVCRLTVRLPDGSTLSKSDAGGYAGMADQGDDDKSGFSDAFKRAAVKFGVGRYLYRDGVPSFCLRRDPKALPAPGAEPAAPRTPAELATWAAQVGGPRGVDLPGWIKKWADREKIGRDDWTEEKVARAHKAARDKLATHKTPEPPR